MGTIIVGAVLLVVVVIIMVSLIKDRKAGKSTCGSNCGCCPMAGKCHGKAK